MSGNETVVRTLVRLGESADAAFGAECAECLPASGDYLVGVGLMSHIEDYLVLGCIEDIVPADDIAE